MNYNRHSDLEGQHAFLSASQYHWLNYDADKLTQAYYNFLAKQKGTELHSFACQCIRLGILLPDVTETLNMYVNDSLFYSMLPELVLYYSDNCFGTADSISFDDGLLRIHDLKTGAITASMRQLHVYAALFCLEYSKDPLEIQYDLRIYQHNAVEQDIPDGIYIRGIMDHIISADRQIDKLKLGVAP